MKEVCGLCFGYETIYREYEDQNGLVRELSEYRLIHNCKLWRIKATYANTLRPSSYYIVAPSRRFAKMKFQKQYPWLDVIASVELVEGEDLSYVLTHPAQVCLS